MNDPKTEIDMLLTDDQRRLKAAITDVLKPIAAGTAEECVELLEALRETNKREETP